MSPRDRRFYQADQRGLKAALQQLALPSKGVVMLKLYVNNFLHDSLQAKTIWVSPLLRYHKYFRWVESPEECDFLVLECLYEVIFDYTEDEYFVRQIKDSDINLFLQSFQRLKDLSLQLNKKIIIFYYRDPDKPLNIPNSVIFRTSINTRSKEGFTFSMPAWIPVDVEEYLIVNSKINDKPNRPSVTFRGQHASLQLPISTNVRLLANQLSQFLGLNYSLETYYVTLS